MLSAEKGTYWVPKTGNSIYFRLNSGDPAIIKDYKIDWMKNIKFIIFD